MSRLVWQIIYFTPTLPTLTDVVTHFEDYETINLKITRCFHVSSRPFCPADSCKRSYRACPGAAEVWHRPRTWVVEVAQIQGKVHHLRIRSCEREADDVAWLHTKQGKICYFQRDPERSLLEGARDHQSLSVKQKKRDIFISSLNIAVLISHQ